MADISAHATEGVAAKVGADLADEVADEEDTLVEEGESRDEPIITRFDVSSYGWDTDVEGLVKRVERGDIHRPGFQRKYVWKNPEKSRFIESLIIGLPVPSIFLAKDSDSNKLNIVDGQQRLLCLHEYLMGKFYLRGKNIQPELVGCYFDNEVAPKKRKYLSESDRRALADSVLHSIVIKPDAEHDDPKYGREYNKAVIQLFSRLNTTGKPLSPQEVRSSIFHGGLNKLLYLLNGNENWRLFFGPEHSRLRDMEIILRFFALNDSWETYKSPMPKFLNNYMENMRHADEATIDGMQNAFLTVMKLLHDGLGVAAFKRKSTFLLSEFDAIAVGASISLNNGANLNAGNLKNKVDELIKDKKYIWAIDEFVNDQDRITARIRRAIHYFSK